MVEGLLGAGRCLPGPVPGPAEGDVSDCGPGHFVSLPNVPGRQQGRGKKPRLWVSELSCRRFDRNAGGLPGGRAALSSRLPPRG